MKKQLLTVAMGLALIASTAQAFDVSKAGQFQTEIQTHVLPILNKLSNSLVKGDFDSLRAQLPGINTDVLFDFIQKNLPQIKSFLTKALNDEQTFNTILGNLPKDLQGQVRSARDAVRSNLNYLDTLAAQLPAIKAKINLERDAAKIVAALKHIAESEEYNTEIKPQLLAVYNNQIKPFADKVQTVDFGAIQSATEALINKLQNKEFDLVSLVVGANEARNFLPAVFGLLNGLTEFALAINNQVTDPRYNLPAELQAPLDTIKQYSGDIKNTLQQFNKQVSDLLQ